MESQDHKAVRSIAAGSELLQWDTQGRIRLGSHLLRLLMQRTDRFSWCLKQN